MSRSGSATQMGSGKGVDPPLEGAPGDELRQVRKEGQEENCQEGKEETEEVSFCRAEEGLTVLLGFFYL